MMRIYFTLFCLLSVLMSFGQKTQVNFFGHFDSFHESEFSGENINSFSLGEHDLFVNSKLTEKISFLNETVINVNADGVFKSSIERARLKYNYLASHSVIFGKMHTPLNYWNDVYHHGRLFFPTIYRPHYFDLLVPIHTTGIRFQGQNLGKLRFGYDLVLGNGMSSSDFLDIDTQKSISAAIHIKPLQEMRIGLSWYKDMINNAILGAHSGHTNVSHSSMQEIYDGMIDYTLYNCSFAYFPDNYEVLFEASMNKSVTDTLGTAINFASFAYIGRKVTENDVIYVKTDFAKIQRNELHTMPMKWVEYSIGFRHDFSYLVTIKFEAEYEYQNHYHLMALGSSTEMSEKHQSLSFKVQIAYGL